MIQMYLSQGIVFILSQTSLRYQCHYKFLIQTTICLPYQSFILIQIQGFRLFSMNLQFIFLKFYFPSTFLSIYATFSIPSCSKQMKNSSSFPFIQSLLFRNGANKKYGYFTRGYYLKILSIISFNLQQMHYYLYCIRVFYLCSYSDGATYNIKSIISLCIRIIGLEIVLVGDINQGLDIIVFLISSFSGTNLISSEAQGCYAQLFIINCLEISNFLIAQNLKIIVFLLWYPQAQLNFNSLFKYMHKLSSLKMSQHSYIVYLNKTKNSCLLIKMLSNKNIVFFQTNQEFDLRSIWMQLTLQFMRQDGIICRLIFIKFSYKLFNFNQESQNQHNQLIEIYLSQRMINKRIFILFFFISFVIAQQPNPNVTQLDYLGQYSLGKQDELNKTFTIITDKLAPLPDITYNYDQTTSYKIFNFTQPTFFVIDSRQKAQIGDNKSITITGSIVETTFSFSWQRIVNKMIILNGTGSTRGKSENILFTKQLILQNDTVFYNLTYFGKIHFTGLQLTRIDPATATFQDKNAVSKLLNYIMDHTSVASQLQQNINNIYSYYLRNFLHDDRHHFSDTFAYHWIDPVKSKGELNIIYQTHLYLLQLDKTALKMQWLTTIRDYAGYQRYNYTLPHPYDARTYGAQQFTSMGLIKNTAMYALQHDIFNTQLSKSNWQSRFFQFYAGDLYEVIPKISQQFQANEPVLGRCQANRLNFDIKKGSHQDTLNVTLSFDCEINILRKKVNDFFVRLELEVEGRPNTDTVDFYVVNFGFNATFNDYLSYKVENKVLGQLMVKHSLNRLIQRKVFGSGWQTLTRDYPHFMVQQNCTVLWDSSHVGPMKSTKTQ